MSSDKFSIDKTYYDLLGVPSNADDVSLHKAFRQLSKSLHPDTTNLPPKEAKIKFQEICEAYEFLGDPLRRQIYDARLQSESSAKRELVLDPSTSPKIVVEKTVKAEVRRPLSGGELFALFLLVAVLSLSLLIGLLFVSMQKRDLQVLPSWLLVNNSIDYLQP